MSVAFNSPPSNLGSLNKPNNWKKRAASDDEGESQFDCKKPKYSWYVKLERESSTSFDDEDAESIYTVQGYETEFARDTSDTSTHSLCTSSDQDDISDHEEYELATESENEDPFLINTSSSEPENILAVELYNFFDSDGLADNSDDSKCSFDGEIKRADFRTCVQCKSINNNPQYRYCERCYQLRKAHFPRSRPRRKPRVPNLEQSNSLKSSQSLSPMDSGLSIAHCELDSTAGSSQNSHQTLSSQEFKTPNKKKNAKDKLQSDENQVEQQSVESDSSQIFSQDSGIGSSQDLDKPLSDSQSNSKNDNSSLNQTKDKTDESQIESSMELMTSNIMSDEQHPHPENDWNSPCLFCTVNSRNGGFPHGKSMHVCCCYNCAKKVWNSNGNRCPICKLKVNRIIKVFL